MKPVNSRQTSIGLFLCTLLFLQNGAFHSAFASTYSTPTPTVIIDPCAEETETPEEPIEETVVPTPDTDNHQPKKHKKHYTPHYHHTPNTNEPDQEEEYTDEEEIDSPDESSPEEPVIEETYDACPEETEEVPTSENNPTPDSPKNDDHHDTPTTSSTSTSNSSNASSVGTPTVDSLAATGTFQENFMNSIFLLGLITFGYGKMIYGKKTYENN